MISGLNTDIQYNGKTYHIQTEDGGTPNPVITTHLFQAGAIQSMRKSSYKDILKSDSLKEIVRDMMKEQHKSVIRELISGKFDRPEEPKAQPASVHNHVQKTEEKAKKSLDDLILDYLSKKEES